MTISDNWTSNRTEDPTSAARGRRPAPGVRGARSRSDVELTGDARSSRSSRDVEHDCDRLSDLRERRCVEVATSCDDAAS